MTFVAQVYAPVEGLHRTLHVHGCARHACCGKSDGWLVSRYQESSVAAAVVAVSASSSVSASAPPTAPVAVDWGALGGGGGGGGWLDDDDDPSMDDLTQLLQARDSALKASSSAAAPPPLSSSSSSFIPAAKATPMPHGWTIDVQWEPYEDTTQGISEDHIRSMIETYAVDEEDTKLVETIRVHSSSSSSSSGGGRAAGVVAGACDADSEVGGDSGGEDDETNLIASLRSKGTKVGGGGCGGGGRCRNPEKIFQERLARVPKQVLRYCYGGEPLWCQALSAQMSSKLARGPPCCKGCGKERVFEMQLMPALLSFLRDRDADARSITHKDGAWATREGVDIGTAVAVATDGPPAGPTGGGTEPVAAAAATAAGVVQPSVEQIEAFFEDMQDSGVDFGVVGVWSCADSCEAGNGKSEWVAVQPPL